MLFNFVVYKDYAWNEMWIEKVVCYFVRLRKMPFEYVSDV